MSQEQNQSRDAVTSEEIDSRSALDRMMHGGRSFSGHERNCCFLNLGAAQRTKGRFANISAVSGLDYPDDGRAVALVDWDHDGDQDMWISNRNAPRLRLMRNELTRGNHFLTLRLEGNGKSTNRDAIGARVEIEFANSNSTLSPQETGHQPRSIKTLRAGEGFLAQSSKWLHFGLGATDAIDRVTVRWPGGEVEQFTDIDSDNRYLLVQGSGMARGMPRLVRETKLDHSVQEVSPSTQVARLPLVELLAMPVSSYSEFNGRPLEVRNQSGRLLLLNLWASWCSPCLAELSEFSKRYEEVQANGIDILALSVDGLGDDNSSKENAARYVSNRQFPFPVGQASSSLIEELQQLHNIHIPLHRPLPLPSSFLIDQQGRLAVIYKGPVSVDQLLEDRDHSEETRLERFVRSAPLVGQAIRHPLVQRTAINSATSVRYQLAESLQQSGRVVQASRLYADVLTLRPDSYWAHAKLGNALQGQGKIVEAIQHYRQALRIKPNDAQSLNNLGLALQSQGKLEAAADRYQQALQINSDYASAHYNLGTVLLRQKKLTAAIGHYRRALDIEAGFAEAHSNLGIALHQQGKLVEATEHYRIALEIKPDYAQANNNLGVALYTMADAYAEAGQFDQAIAAATKALHAATAAGNEQLAQKIRGQVVVYQQRGLVP